MESLCVRYIVSDILAHIGTTILCVFWPSFVGATETAVLKSQTPLYSQQYVLSLMASTAVTFFLSQKLNGSISSFRGIP